MSFTKIFSFRLTKDIYVRTGLVGADHSSNTFSYTRCFNAHIFISCTWNIGKMWLFLCGNYGGKLVWNKRRLSDILKASATVMWPRNRVLSSSTTPHSNELVRSFQVLHFGVHSVLFLLHVLIGNKQAYSGSFQKEFLEITFKIGSLDVHMSRLPTVLPSTQRIMFGPIGGVTGPTNRIWFV